MKGELRRIQENTLKFLAVGGETTAYNLSKQMPNRFTKDRDNREHVRDRVSVPSITQALSKLRDMGYAAAFKAKRETRGPAERIIHDVTRRGLWALLHSVIQTPQQAWPIAELHGSKLPWILGRWKTFEDCKVEHLALKILHSGMLNPNVQDFMDPVMSAAIYAGGRLDGDYDPTSAFYMAAPLVLDDAELSSWLTIFRWDTELAGKLAEIHADVEYRLSKSAEELQKFRELLTWKPGGNNLRPAPSQSSRLWS